MLKRDSVMRKQQNIIIGFSLLLIVMVIVVMVKDFFYRDQLNQKNPYEYNLDKLKRVDSKLIGYAEVQQIQAGEKEIKALATDKQNRIYVVAGESVMIYDAKGALQYSFKTGKKLSCITIGPKGKIYLGVENHVEVWNRSGKLIRSWEASDAESLITSIAVSDHSVFVADAGQWIVHQYDLNGKLVNRIGRKNVEKGIPGFFIPSPYFDVAIGREGQLWVVNPGRHSLEAYDTKGNLISSWSRSSMQLDGFSGCCNPSHIAMLSDGSFVTSEKGIERVKVHQPSGDFKCVVAPPKLFKEGTRGLDLAVDTEDRILVLDPVKGLIRIFEKKDVERN
jgi:sugar lactone lactonase YvrE